MDKNDFKRTIEQIDVPKEKVFSAIEEGLKEARANKTKSLKKRILLSTSIAAALIGITIISGFVNPTINKVLAKAPIIGELFKEFDDSRGVQLAQENRVTKLNESLTRNGVTVELTSAYFDGNIISITGWVDGDVEKGTNEPGEVSFDVNFENYKGDLDPWIDRMVTDIRKKDNGYIFQWQIKYPHRDIEEFYSLPITIHYINGIKAQWKFNVPIKQQKYQKLHINKEKMYADEGVQLRLEEIISAKTSASMVIETVTKNKNISISLGKAVDDKGNIYDFSYDNTFSETKDEEGYHELFRVTTRDLPKDISSLTFYPSVAYFEPDLEQVLNKESFSMKSKYSNVVLKVNDVQKKGNELLIDYQFVGLPKKLSNHMLDLYENNLSYAFKLIYLDYIYEIDPENPIGPENHSVSRNKVTVIDQEKVHFQSTFSLNDEEQIENFKLENTVLQFNFYSFIDIYRKELEPFTVELTD